MPAPVTATFHAPQGTWRSGAPPPPLPVGVVPASTRPGLVLGQADSPGKCYLPGVASRLRCQQT
jgi:hypothetical protein